MAPRFALLLLFVMILVLGGAINKQKKLIASEKANAVSQERPPVNTVILTVSPSAIHDRINLPGSVEPWTDLRLMARISGTISEVLVTEGDEIHQGDILARIESDDYQIALNRAQAAYKLAKTEYERAKRVHAKGVIPVAELDGKETTMLTAKADLSNARLLLSRCQIVAPMSGVVKRLDAKVGLLLSVGDPVAQILKIDQVKAVVGIPESDVSAVRKLSEVNLEIQALENREVQGQKHFLSPSPDSGARLYRLELALTNSDRQILPGMFIRANIVKRTAENAIAIPFYSVISRNDEQYVFVERDGIAYKQMVSLGIMENWMVEVTSGLATGDKVIIEGHRDVEDNQKVNVVKTITDPGAYTI